MKDVGASEKAACFIKFSQTEKSSEISLTQCFPDKKGDSYHKRSRGGLIAAFLLFIIVVGILAFLYRGGRTAPGTGRAAQENSPAHGSGECQLLCSADSQQQPNSDRATSSQAVDYENEKPEAGKELNKEDGALKDKRIVNNGVNQEVTLEKEAVPSEERKIGTGNSSASLQSTSSWMTSVLVENLQEKR
ncbi:PREDICTED: uncharacterized protein LOC103895152 [Aptenodytes forsteri]|uniref:uncharacterized protein LOC103895152 n=1 Tax=Aptenodytes forsteri TaxID=9233 RepID=UPI000905CFCD|nr:PREDICTED: uncharacterized protein LOC103895152 [Aptenodytes forsteri]